MRNINFRAQAYLMLLLSVVLIALTVRIRKVDSESHVSETSIINLPAIFKNFDPTLGVPIFGVQMYGNTGSSSVYHPSLSASGASWLRVSIPWKAVEPVNVSPDAYNWLAADRSISAARKDMGGLKLIATISDAPDWAATLPQGPIDKVELDEFVDFVQAMVQRYNGDGVEDAPGSPIIEYWEFYNEPDWGSIPGREGWGNDGDEYAQMLKAVYPVVKSTNPSAQVVFGGIAYDWFEDQNGPFVREFLDNVLASDGGQYFDVMNFHAYPSFWSNWTLQESPGLLEKAQFIRGKLDDYGIDKPLIITEAGWHSNNPVNFPSSQEIQARYVVELFTQSLAADVKIMIWWMLYDPGGGFWDNGLVTDDSMPMTKLSFDAYQTIVAELSSAHFERTLSVAETGSSAMEAYKFNDDVNRLEIYVAWIDPVDTNVTEFLSLPAPQAIVLDIYGNSTAVSDGDDGQFDGRVTVQVGGQPIYVEISK